MAIYITGIPGTGKSTVIEFLRKRNVLCYDMDYVPNLCSRQHKKVVGKTKCFTVVGKNWLKARNWICNVDKLKKLIQQHKNENVIIAGISSNQEKYLHFFTKIFLLYCDEANFLHRLATRNNNSFAKDASQQKYILGWYKSFQKHMLSKGAIPINTANPIEDVVAKILHEIKSK